MTPSSPAVGSAASAYASAAGESTPTHQTTPGDSRSSWPTWLLKSSVTARHSRVRTRVVLCSTGIDSRNPVLPPTSPCVISSALQPFCGTSSPSDLQPRRLAYGSSELSYTPGMLQGSTPNMRPAGRKLFRACVLNRSVARRVEHGPFLGPPIRRLANPCATNQTLWFFFTRAPHIVGVLVLNDS